jgi:hypothetical protein
LTGSNSIFNISATTSVWNFECWIYPIASGYFFAIGSGSAYGNSIAVNWGSGTANKFQFVQGNGSNAQPVNVTTTGTYPGSIWYHIAVSRTSAGVLTMFINGVADGTVTYNTAAVAGGTTFVVNGVYDNNGLGNNGGNFYISNLRFLVGSTIYTSPFTPPAGPLTVTQTSSTNIAAITTATSLLTAQSSRFIDTSYATTVTTLTLAGTPQIAQYNPFSVPGTLTRAPNTYGIFFNGGTSDYLARPTGSSIVL